MIGLNKHATVYTAHPTTGEWTILFRAGLPVRLANKVRKLDPVTDNWVGREEIQSDRRLLWGPEPALPSEYCQVLVDGERWNTVAGSFTAITGPTGAVTYRRCEVRRAV